ncbi:MAG: hypothetical protein Q9M27_06630 [Mariprofundaceae bacterium]|nr:hypothetical protein [Mariprofundaceae bacterium]
MTPKENVSATSNIKGKNLTVLSGKWGNDMRAKVYSLDDDQWIYHGDIYFENGRLATTKKDSLLYNMIINGSRDPDGFLQDARHDPENFVRALPSYNSWHTRVVMEHDDEN